MNHRLLNGRSTTREVPRGVYHDSTYKNPIVLIIDIEVGGLPVADKWYDNAQERVNTIHATATELAAVYNIELDTITESGRQHEKPLTTLTNTTSSRSSWEPRSTRNRACSLGKRGGNSNASCPNTGNHYQMTWSDHRSLVRIRTADIANLLNRLEASEIPLLCGQKSAAIRSLDVLYP